MHNETATVETLTAEVRVLMVGSRQVTLSVAKQLDEVQPDDIIPFGRISTGGKLKFASVGEVEVIGSREGVLVRSRAIRQRYLCSPYGQGGKIISGGREHLYLRCPNEKPHSEHSWNEADGVYDEWQSLPLIVLAGLR